MKGNDYDFRIVITFTVILSVDGKMEFKLFLILQNRL